MAKNVKKTKTGAEGVKWSLGDLYSGLGDKAIGKDLKSLSGKAVNFEKRYRGKINSSSITAKELLSAVKKLEEISEQTGKLLSYAYLVFAADTSRPEHGAFLQSVQEKTTDIRKHLIFFELEWTALNDKKAEKLLRDKKLSHYAHFLEQERKYRPHRLSEPEERILDEKANTGSRAFKRLFDEVLNNITFEVKLDGKPQSLTETQTLALLYDPDRDKRKAAARGLTEGLKEHSHILTFIFNTLVQDHAVSDRLRSFDYPMQSRHLDNEIDRDTVEALITSCEKNYGLSIEYHKLKRKILGVRTLYDYDRYAPLLKDTGVIKYTEGKEIILDAFSGFSSRMSDIAGMFFDKNWIDAEARDGKRGGAFSHGTVPGAHPYVFTNYTGRMRDVMTLAHELGHGVHQYLSRSQGYFQSNTPLTTAETASVFAEMLVFHTLLEKETDPGTKLALICGKLEDIFATVFRQVVLTRFEQSLHEARRESGELSTEAVNELWANANSPLFGDSIKMTEDYRSWWMYIPHFIHSPFYCYAYSFGELLVLALYNKYLNEGGSFVPQYLELLSSGGSKPPDELLMNIGVDIKDKTFWQSGLDLLSAMVSDAKEQAALAGY